MPGYKSEKDINHTFIKKSILTFVFLGINTSLSNESRFLILAGITKLTNHSFSKCLTITIMLYKNVVKK